MSDTILNELAERLHQANEHLHSAREALERAMDGCEYRHQERTNLATGHFREAEKQAEEVADEIIDHLRHPPA